MYTIVTLVAFCLYIKGKISTTGVHKRVQLNVDGYTIKCTLK